MLSRHKNSDHFTEEEETSSLSLFLVSSLHRKRRETRDREREREREERFVSISQNRKRGLKKKKRGKNMRCCVCYSDETELGDCEVIECASGHVTCAECFNEHVKVETAKGAGYVRFVFLRFITCGKRLEERERERKRVVLIHHQRVSPLLLFCSFDCRLKKRSFSRAHICSLLLLLLRSLRELLYRRA